MILVGVCVHSASLHRLPAVLAYWSRLHRPDIASVEVVFNGRLRPDVPGLLRAAARGCAVPVGVTVRPSGHLAGFGPLREAQEALRRRALERGASHLLFHEVDRMPGDTALDDLLAADAAVAGALYRDPYTLGFYCVFEFWTEGGRERHRFDVVPDPLPVAPFPVPGIGFGFTLVRRDVLRAVTFRSGRHAPDSFFCLDVRRAGFRIVAVPVLVWNAKVDGQPEVLAVWHAAADGALPANRAHRYPAEFRARVLHAHRLTPDLASVVARFGVPEDAVGAWLREDGRTAG